jgi:prevent-host-death family protein
MQVFNIHEAKTHLSRLLEQVANGESFVIAKAGVPVARVSPVAPPRVASRLGSLEGAFEVPDDFDELGKGEIAALFGLDQ